MTLDRGVLSSIVEATVTDIRFVRQNRKHVVAVHRKHQIGL